MCHLNIHVLSSGRCAQLLRLENVGCFRHQLLEVIRLFLSSLVHHSALVVSLPRLFILKLWWFNIIHIKHLEVNTCTLRVGVNHIHNFAHSRGFADRRFLLLLIIGGLCRGAFINILVHVDLSRCTGSISTFLFLLGAFALKVLLSLTPHNFEHSEDNILLGELSCACHRAGTSSKFVEGVSTIWRDILISLVKIWNLLTFPFYVFVVQKLDDQIVEMSDICQTMPGATFGHGRAWFVRHSLLVEFFFRHRRSQLLLNLINE